MLGTQEVMKSDIKINSDSKIENFQHKVLFKDQNSIWYANDQYYTDRNLEIPTENSTERFLKGAYGEQTIFLNSGWSLFSTDLAGLEIDQAIIVDQAFITNVFEILSVDTLVEFS